MLVAWPSMEKLPNGIEVVALTAVRPLCFHEAAAVVKVEHLLEIVFS